MVRVAVAVLAASLWIAGPLALRASADDALEQVLVETASTPQQHQALAKHFEAKAAEHRKLAESHRTMGKHYAGNATVRKQGMEHCEGLAKLNDQMAEQYEALAKLHQAQAGQ